MNYYIVTAKCGHVGKDYYIPIDFPVRAESKTEAAKIVRSFPRVKHHHKDAILGCREASIKEYNKNSLLSCLPPQQLHPSELICGLLPARL